MRNERQTKIIHIRISRADKMSDIKTVIALLCKHLRQTVDATLIPEHFRLAKFNKDADNTVIELWKVLYQLSSCALKEIPGEIFLNDYDDVTFVKLYFAYLQYLVPEFYSLPLDCRGGSRELLLAFSWLLATQNVLTIAIDKKISNSILAQEFSNNHVPKAVTTHQDDLLSTNSQFHRIIHVCGQISYNIRAISDLVSEKAKLATKAHAASINVWGLPHLSISEIGITKRLAVDKSGGDEQHMHDLYKLASVLDTHAKWEAKRHIFFDWMVTVIEEHKISQVEAVPSRESDCELSRFVCLLRHIVKKNLHNLKRKDEISPNVLSTSNCVSRLLRTQSNYSETETWISEVKQQLENEKEAARKKTDRLAIQLKKMLRLIPHCVKI